MKTKHFKLPELETLSIFDELGYRIHRAVFKRGKAGAIGRQMAIRPGYSFKVKPGICP